MPFRVQEIQDTGGIYCGINAVSKNLLICNRKKLLNPTALSWASLVRASPSQ